MGWSGYGIYDGDCTQTCHFDFLHLAKVSTDDDEIEGWLTNKGTKLPKDKIPILQKNISLVLKKMPKVKLSKTEEKWDTKDADGESNALEWQMLLSLFVDNKIAPPEIVFDMGIAATNYLMKEHAEEFDRPHARRAKLKSFVAKAEKIGK